VRTFKDRPCLGTRTYLGTQKADPYHPQPAPRLPLARLCSRKGPFRIARGCRDAQSPSVTAVEVWDVCWVQEKGAAI
jgi:hypothetical protein